MRTLKTGTLSGQPQRLQVIIASRHIAMLDGLAVDIRMRHGAAISRAAILRAIVEAAQRTGLAERLFGV